MLRAAELPWLVTVVDAARVCPAARAPRGIYDCRGDDPHSHTDNADILHGHGRQVRQQQIKYLIA